MYPANFKKAFGAKVKEYRLLNNLTQSQLAEKLNLETSTIGKIEMGENFTTAEVICGLCDVLKIPPRVLFDFGVKFSKKTDYRSIIDEIMDKLIGCDSKDLQKLKNVIACLVDE